MGVTAIYTRISRDREGERGGVERQRSDCTGLCDRNGWDYTVFEDNDTSAYSGKKRPGYIAMLDAVKAGDVERIVTWHPDRLHRHPRELEDFIEVVDATGCDVVTVAAGHYDITTSAGRQVARILGAVARGESEHKSERIKRKHEQLAADGQWNGGGKRPYGYRVVDVAGRAKLEVIDDEAEVVREIVSRFLRGENLSAIGHDLNDRGIPAARGGNWTSTSLRSLVGSALISGQREHLGRITGPGAWDAIVTPEETKRARSVLAAHKTADRQRARSFLLTGLVYCDRCKSGMVGGRTSTGKPRYTCSAGVGRPSCGRLAIVAEPVEALIRSAVVRVVDSPEFADRIRRRAKLQEQSEGNELTVVRAAEAQLAELADAYADNLISLSDWVQARRKIEGRAEAAQVRVADRSLAPILPFIAKPGLLDHAWDDLTFSQLHALLASVIERIHVAPAPTTGRVPFDSRRVSVTWRV